MKLNYGILKPGEQITFKQEAHESSYNTLKKEIDGTLDVVQLATGLDCWINDEGLLLELEPTLIIKNVPSPKIENEDIYIVGPIVFACHNCEGETISLDEKSKKVLDKFIPVRLGDKQVMMHINF